MTHEVGKSSGTGSIRSFFESSTDSPTSQYQAAMNGVVVLDRSHLARVAARGSDRVRFLHNMLSADINKLTAAQGTEATFLTNKGKLVANLTVFHDDDQLLLEIESPYLSSLTGALSRYIISEDVTLEPLEDEQSFSVEGPSASKLLATIADVSADELDALPHLGTRRAADSRVTARRLDPSPRFDVAAPDAIAIKLLEAAREHGATVAGPALAQLRRIEAGRPQFGVDMDESHLPLEAGLHDAINFEKGCYIGQEYVVRLAHRGHLNRKLVGIRVESETPPPSGAKVTSGGTEAGELTSSAYSPTLGATVALGYVRREFFEPGTELKVDGNLKATVSALPFL